MAKEAKPKVNVSPRLAVGAKGEEEALAHYRRVRDEIRTFVERMAKEWRA